MDFEMLDSQTVFHGRVFAVRQDQLRAPDGKLFRVDVVDHRGAVTLVPVDSDGRIWFVRQYRHPAGQMVLELPAGVMEEDEEAIISAEREIREEIGMAASNLKFLGSFFLAPGYSTELMHVYLATGLSEDALQQDEDEYLSVEKIPVNQVYAMAESGEIQDAKSMGALLLARRFLLPE